MSSTQSPTLSSADTTCLAQFTSTLNTNPLLQPMTAYGVCLEKCYKNGGSSTTCNSPSNDCYTKLQTDLLNINNSNTPLGQATSAFTSCVTANNNTMPSTAPIFTNSPHITSPPSGLSMGVIIGIACAVLLAVLLLGVVVYENYKKPAKIVEGLAVASEPLNTPRAPSSRSVPSKGSRVSKGSKGSKGYGKKKKNKSR